MPGMPGMMAFLPGTAAAGYELIYVQLGGLCLACFLDSSAQNREVALADADRLLQWNDTFRDLLPITFFIFPPAYIPYLFYAMSIDTFVGVQRDVARHLPKGPEFEGDYPPTWPWEHWFPQYPNPLIDTEPI